MENVADVGAQNDQRQRAEDLSALGGNHPGHVGKHTDGTQGDDEFHQPLNHGISGGHHVPDQLGLLTGSQNGAAEQQGNDDDLKHVGFGKRLPHVGGENGDQSRHEAGVFLGLVLGGLSGLAEVGEQARVVEHRCQNQTDDAGHGSGDHEVENGLPAHGAYLFHVAHGDDAVDHRQQHHRHHDELQQVDEDITEGLDVAGGEVGRAGEVEHQTDNDTQYQSNKDLYRQGQFFLFFHRIRSLFHTF